MQQHSELLVAQDMRYGRGLVNQLARVVLRWACSMLHVSGISKEESRRLHAVVGTIAHRAAWAEFDVLAHEAPRCLFRLALYTAAQGEDHNLGTRAGRRGGVGWPEWRHAALVAVQQKDAEPRYEDGPIKDQLHRGSAS